MSYSHRGFSPVISGYRNRLNRFNGFRAPPVNLASLLNDIDNSRKTVKTVPPFTSTAHTGLKPGVNEMACTIGKPGQYGGSIIVGGKYNPVATAGDSDLAACRRS
jgi:hypothetical protein